MAETYGVFDYQALPARTAAALFWGLRDDARAKLRMSGSPVGVDTLLRAAIADRLGILVWFQTRDGREGRNRPESYLAQLLGESAEGKSEVRSFATPEDFLAEWNRLSKGGGDGEKS